MKERNERVEFKPPKDFHLPEGVEPGGGKFSMVCDFQVKDGGTICLTKLGDTDMPGYENGEQHEEPHKPSYKDYSSRMSGGQMPVNQAPTEGGY
jgi:hypothetical protein